MRHLTWPAIAIAALASAPLWAQQPGHEQHRPGPGAPPPRGPGMMDEKCAMMQQKMDAMHGKMQAEHDKMQHLMHEMNTATGSAKTEAMAAAINAIADNCDQMHKMESDMMRAMMEHMSEHMVKDGGKSMPMCPMMQEHGAGGAEHGALGAPAPPPGDRPDAPQPPKPTPDDHSEHHPSR